MARELLWMQRRRATNSTARRYLSEVDASFRSYPPKDWRPLSPPRTYAAQELKAELGKRLTLEEQALAVSPIESTEEIAATARNLTEGVTNVEVKAALLFAHVAEQRLKAAALDAESQPSTGTQLACHFYASQLVALARAIDVPGWLVHVEITSEELTTYHDRAALMIGGRLLQSDPTWGLLWMSEAEDERIRILDDLQAIAHHLCQSDSIPTVRAGMKLDPEDLWTRLVSICKLASRNHLDEAEALLKSSPPECTNRWDYYLDRGIIEAKKGDFEASLRSLQKADQLGPNCALVNLNLGLVYGFRQDNLKAGKHLQKAKELGAAGHLSNPQGLDTEIRMRNAEAIPANVSLDTLRRRAAEGDKAARLALVNRLLKLGPQARDEAMNLLRQTAEEGDPMFQVQYSRNLLLLRGRNAAEEAVGFFRKAAIQGNATAQYELGVLLYEGKLIQKDEVEASQWMHLAAQSGHKDARSLLREMELFLDRTAFEAGRKRAAEFKPVTAVTGK
jgi:TPR repeat protein